jgi:hypothetical protein
VRGKPRVRAAAPLSLAPLQELLALAPLQELLWRRYKSFWRWRRYKSFWRGQYAEGHDPGLTYDRASVEVAIKETPADAALDEEARLIRRLRPRDNLLGQPELEEAPF